MDDVEDHGGDLAILKGKDELLLLVELTQDLPSGLAISGDSPVNTLAGVPSENALLFLLNRKFREIVKYYCSSHLTQVLGFRFEKGIEVRI